MSSLLTLLSAIVLAFWVLLAADRKRGWPSSLELDLAGGRPPWPGAPDTAVVVPARNEAEALGRTLPALLGQGEELVHLVLVDDCSEDGTGALARKAIAAAGAEERATVLEGSPPPPGWSGKLAALEAGVRRALAEASGRENEAAAVKAAGWLLFTDADILHPAGSIRALRAQAEEGPCDLASVMVRLRAENFWEKLLIPPFVYFFQLLYPFRRVCDPASSVAAAAGGCLLIRRELLEKIGGLESIHDAVIDDVALARRAKAGGGRLWLGLCPEMVSLRGYPGLRDIARMVSRTAFTQLRRSYTLLSLTAVAITLFLVSPPLLCVAAAVAGEPPALAGAALAWGVQALTLLPAVRHHRVAAPYALTLPLASALYLAMTLLSAWRHLRGQGPGWKGRRIGEGKAAAGAGS